MFVFIFYTNINNRLDEMKMWIFYIQDMNLIKSSTKTELNSSPQMNLIED